MTKTLLWLAAAAGLALAAPARAESPEDLVRKGNDAYARGDFAAAREL